MPRNASYDYARLIAAFGIVQFHAGAPGAAVGYAALPFFLMLMLVMAAPAAGSDAPGPYARRRAQRLLRPWLIWSGIYAALKLAEVALTSSTLGDEFALHMLLTGPALHLWFLPFAFVACLLLYPVVRLARSGTPRPVIVAMMVLGLALLGWRQGTSFSAPVAQWVYVAPAACLGLAMALAARNIVTQSLLAIVFVAISATLGWIEGLPQIALAAAALLLCGIIYLPITPASQIAAQSALGVYLAHPMVFSLIERALPFAPGGLIFAVLGGLGALGLALIMQRLANATRSIEA